MFYNMTHIVRVRLNCPKSDSDLKRTVVPENEMQIASPWLGGG